MRRRATLATVVVGAVAIGAAALLAGCGDTDPSSPTAADLDAIDASPDHTIVVDEDGFEPATLEVDAGDLVLLVNEGADPHSFTAGDQRFDTGLLHPGDDTTLVLTEPGEVAFHDRAEPDHEGTLTVMARD